MSRAAASDARKADQKVAIAIKKAEREADLAMGLTTAMAKAIRDDELICTTCGATKQGPVTKCECTGGRTKPGPDYCCKRQLLDAAKARFATAKAAEMKEAARNQDTVASSRTKKREGKAADDMAIEVQGDGHELTVVVPFPVGKLGMSMEKNAVSGVTGEPAVELGVKKGWVLSFVAGEQTMPDKSAISKLIMRAFKEVPAGAHGLVEFKFRTPLVAGFSHCSQCDKFVADEEFDGAQLEAGPGKQMCAGCEEISAMGF